MKTKNNYQKSENRRTIRNSLLAVVALTLCSFSLIVLDFFNHLSDNVRSKPLAMKSGGFYSNETKNDAPALKFEPIPTENLEFGSLLKNIAETERLSPDEWYSFPNASFTLKTYFN